MSHPVPSLSPQADRWLALLAIALYVWQSHGQDPEPLLQDWESIAAMLWQRKNLPEFTGLAALPQRYLDITSLELPPANSLLPELDLQLAIARQQGQSPEAIAIHLADWGYQYGMVIMPLTWWRSLPQARLRSLSERFWRWQVGYRQPLLPSERSLLGE